jgi:hypothetical protein
VAVTSPHNKIINAVARAKLRPLGLQQKGRSRVWHDDRRWYGIMVEFRASRYRKSSSLNVGISWFWYPREYWSFDKVRHEPGDAEFQDETQFQRDFERLADQAVETIHRYRDPYASLGDAYQNVDISQAGLRPGGWPDLHLALLAGLNGEAERARRLLRQVPEQESRYEWQAARRAFCEKAIDRVADVGALRTWIEENIAACRQLRGLPSLQGPLLPAQ